MNEGLVVDLFVEDRAHEEFIGAIVRRIAREARTARFSFGCGPPEEGIRAF